MRKLVILAAMALMICVGSVDAHEIGKSPNARTLRCPGGNATKVHFICVTGPVKRNAPAVNHSHHCAKGGNDKGKPTQGECKK